MAMMRPRHYSKTNRILARSIGHGIRSINHKKHITRTNEPINSPLLKEDKISLGLVMATIMIFLGVIYAYNSLIFTIIILVLFFIAFLSN